MQGFDAWITSDQYAHLEDLLYITLEWIGPTRKLVLMYVSRSTIDKAYQLLNLTLPLVH